MLSDAMPFGASFFNASRNTRPVAKVRCTTSMEHPSKNCPFNEKAGELDETLDSTVAMTESPDMALDMSLDVFPWSHETGVSGVLQIYRAVNIEFPCAGFWTQA